jgi:steroid delta-isomerase
MPSAEQMRAAMRRYLECVGNGDLDGVLSLFAESISVEDPVGGGPGTHVVGRDEVAAFFGRGFERTRPRPTPTGPIRTTAGNEAAMPFTLRLTLRGRVHEIDVVDVMRFDDAGKITSLRAFWNPDEMRVIS